MKKLYVLFLFTVLFSSCNNVVEERTKKQEKYLQETKLFLNSIHKDQPIKKILLLVREPKFQYAEKIFQNDYFNDLEKIEINKQIGYPAIKDWKDVLPKDLNYITKDSLNLAFRDLHNFDFWTFIIPNIQNGAKSMSAPIFLKNYNYCIFYSDTCYVRLKENGNISLYKKTNNDWKIFKKIYEWKKE